MPTEFPFNSSTKHSLEVPASSHSNAPATPRKNTRESAQQTAGEAFAARPSIAGSTKPAASAAQAGQRRLSGAFYITLDRIEPDPDQPRKQLDDQHVEELTASIKRLGVLQPISVRLVDGSDKYRIIAGECRYTAAQRAGLREVPCWVRTPEEKLILLEQAVENWQRSDLNPFELADSLGILRDANGISQKQLAEMTGKSAGEISKILSLLDLDPEVQGLARSDDSGRVTRKHLYAVRDFPVDRQLKLVAGIQDGRYTAESLELLHAKQQSRSPTGREHNWQKRTFKTREATVSFTFRKSSVDGHDILNALRQVKRQVGEDGVV